MKTESSSLLLATTRRTANPSGRLRVAASAGAMLDILRDHWLHAAGDAAATGLAVSRIDYEMMVGGANGGRATRLSGAFFADASRAAGQKAAPVGDDRVPGFALVRKGSLRREVLAAALHVPARRVGAGAAEVLNSPAEGHALVRFRFGRAGGTLPLSVIAHMYEGSSPGGSKAFAAMTKLRRHGLDSSAGGVGGGGRVARPIAYVPRWRMILREDVTGATLRHLPATKQEAGAGAIGRLLARLHRAPPGVARGPAATRDAADLESLVALAIEVMPYQLAAVAGAHADVRRDFAKLPAHEPRLIHGDFQPRHLLIDGNDAVLLDCDSVGQGDPARDIGTFLAHLRLLTLRGGEAWPEMELAFLAGYGALDPALESRTIAYLKAELLALACRCAFSTPQRENVRPLLHQIGRGVPALAV